MASEKLIPILGIVKGLRERREIHLDVISSGTWTTTYLSSRVGGLGHALAWIDQNTAGRFYFDPLRIAFEDEKDMIMFKLGFKDAT